MILSRKSLAQEGSEQIQVKDMLCKEEAIWKYDPETPPHSSGQISFKMDLDTV